MDHLFNALVSRRTSAPCAINEQDSSCTMKKMLKRASFAICSRSCAKNNAELANVMDEQLMQIRERLAEFREQDSHFRERIDSLSGSVSELSSRSSFTPSECSDLGSMDEFSKEEEENEHSLCQKASSSNFSGLSRIPTVRVTGAGNSNNTPVKCFHMRQSSDPSSLYNVIQLPKEEVMETRRHSSYSADRVYPQYDNPEEISTLL